MLNFFLIKNFILRFSSKQRLYRVKTSRGRFTAAKNGYFFVNGTKENAIEVKH